MCLERAWNYVGSAGFSAVQSAFGATSGTACRWNHIKGGNLAVRLDEDTWWQRAAERISRSDPAMYVSHPREITICNSTYFKKKKKKSQRGNDRNLNHDILNRVSDLSSSRCLAALLIMQPNAFLTFPCVFRQEKLLKSNQLSSCREKKYGSFALVKAKLLAKKIHQNMRMRKT